MIKEDLALDARPENLVVTYSVGWLGEEQLREPSPEPVAQREELVSILWEFCRRSVLRRRGLHYCPVCACVIVAASGDESLLLGGAEIRTFLDGKVYAAPDLIFHYIEEHGYAPPPVFVDSVLRPPWPGTGSYARLVGQAVR